MLSAPPGSYYRAMALLIVGTSEERSRTGVPIAPPRPEGETSRDAGIRAGSQSDLASFLRTRRRSIPADSGTLGSWERLPVRRGRRVSQEELAEAVNVSRNWYRRLESGDAPRVSAKLLDRIAKVFQLSPEERASLFILAIPELAQMRVVRSEARDGPQLATASICG
jgi:DNA-binding XRE family transcriptional regulator